MAPDRDVLSDLYVAQELSLAEIARRYGVTKTAVSRWLRRAGIPTRDIALATKLAMRDPAIRAKCATGPRTGNRTPRTPEQREAQRQKMLGRTPSNKGKPWTPGARAKYVASFTPERREKHAADHRGEKSPFWRGGRLPGENELLNSWRWRQRRRECYDRDRWTCQDCGQRCWNRKHARKHGNHRLIQAHHIVARRDGGSDELENLVTLCMSCHHKRERVEAPRRKAQ